jgi:hypothetical protein
MSVLLHSRSKPKSRSEGKPQGAHLFWFERAKATAQIIRLDHLVQPVDIDIEKRRGIRRGDVEALDLLGRT